MTNLYHRLKKHKLAIWILCVILCLPIYSNSHFLPSNADEDIVVSIVAHRGYAGAYPENTLSSFAGATSVGAKTVEFDVRKTKDDVLVIFHDETLERITGETDKGIADYTYQELLELDAGSWYSDDFIRERIPTLDQALDLLNASGCRIFLEMKDIGPDASFASEVYSCVDAHRMIDRTVFLSFNYDYLSGIKEQNMDCPIMLLASVGRPSLVRKYPAEFYGINMKTVSSPMIQAAHKAGSVVYAYSPSTRGQVLNLQRLGIDGIITDYPDVTAL